VSVSILLASAMVMAGVTPAYANTQAQQCQNYTWNPPSSHDRTVCSMVNSNDNWDDAAIEGLMQWNRQPFDGTDETVEVQIDYIRLTKHVGGGQWMNATQINGEQARLDLSGWWCGYPDQNNCTQPNSNIAPIYGFSTNWVFVGPDHCNEGPPSEIDGPGLYRTEIRFRLQWMDVSGDPVGVWKVLQSDSVTLSPDQCL